ncbi:kinase-like protein, partial [Trichocladium antarcticum]
YELETDAGHSVEELRSYRPGGYHPVVLGDRLGPDGRYRVAHKLGYGGYATVWLCHDSVAGKWRAVKMMAAALSGADCADLRALALFGGIDRAVLAANGLQLALDHFWLDGPNGRHLGFVLPLLGPNLSGVFDVYGHLPELVKDICFQLVAAMRFMHSHGLCHGDFRSDNIMFRLVDGVDEWPEAALVRLLGAPVCVPVRPVAETETETETATATEREPGMPPYLVQRASIDYGSGVCASEMAVIDFGVSYHVARPPVGKGTGIPLQYAAPEEVFEEDGWLGFQTDIWSLGVTMAEARLGYTPFASDTDDLVRGVEKLECVVGPMPHPFRETWRRWGGDFVNCLDDAGRPRDDDGWRDETVFATVDTEEEEWLHADRADELGAGNHLEYRMNRPRLMGISNTEAADLAAQAQADPRRLPTYAPAPAPATATDGNHTVALDQRVIYTMDKREIRDMFDLLLRIFQWRPDQRASLEDILDHDWFGQRS